MAARLLLLLSLVPLSQSAFAQSVHGSALEARLQEMLQEVADFARKVLKQDVAMQIGWHSKSEQFTVVAGSVNGNGAQRPVKTEDTFLYGSGTKPFTAAAVMRLIDQGKVAADDRAHVHIDPYLKAQNGTTLEELFGPLIANATVLDLIRMSAGLPNFEVGTRDADILQAGNQVWPVYSNIRYSAEFQKKYGGTCQSVTDCACGKLPPFTKADCIPQQNRCMKFGPYPGCWGKPSGFRLQGGWICWKGQRFNFCPTTKGSTGTICAPGTCSSYSSASYEVAGLLLAAVGSPGRPYTDMDLGDFVLPERERYPSLAFPPVTSQSQHDVKSFSISQNLTVPGTSMGMFGEKGTTIFNQHPSILGWTCGHMVGAAGDVARFFYDLFNPQSSHPIVSNSSFSEMTRTKPLSMGWGGKLRYGAGIMEFPFSQNRSYQPSNRSQWGWNLGHAGLTYGFASNQGYVVPAGAGFSINSNTDSAGFAGLALCKTFEIAAEVIGGQRIYLNCSNSLGINTMPHDMSMRGTKAAFLLAEASIQQTHEAALII